MFSSLVRWRVARELGGQDAPRRCRPAALSSTSLVLLLAVSFVGCTADADRVRVVAYEPALAVDPECFGLDTGGLRTDDVTCATVTVPLRHDDPAAGTIELAVAVLPGRHADEFEHPTLLLGGGPGGAMVEPFLTSLGVRMAYDVGPDLIVVDQRGVGLSEPALDCPELRGLGLEEDPVEGPTAYLSVVGACRDRLRGEGIDLDAFDHLANAGDIDLVRRAHDGDLGPLLRLTLDRQPADGLSMGMYYSMTCSGTPTDLEAQLAAAEDGVSQLVTPLWLTPYLQELCEVWDVEVTLDPGSVELDIAIPTLIVTGGLDLVTPPEHGERVHASLPVSQLLEVPAGVHAPLERLGHCGRRIAADFLRDPDALVETACAREDAVTFAHELPARFGGSTRG
jgi:pimeloyl-ACP methyl ester carboxylesterase